MTRSRLKLLLITAIILCLRPAAPDALVSGRALTSRADFGVHKAFRSMNGFRSTLVSAFVEENELGRWKLDGSGGCYWDEYDDGPDQCDPNNPDGRYKLDGNGGCYWEQYDFGPDQCDPNSPPPSGQYRLDGDGRCYYDPNGTGANQCSPTPIGPGDGYGTNVQQPSGCLQSCTPPRSGTPAPGTIYFAFSDANVPADQVDTWNKLKAAFVTAAQKWNTQLKNWRMPNRLEPGSGGYTVSWGLAGGDYALTTSFWSDNTGYIRIASRTMTEAAGAKHGDVHFLNFVASQELGHALGFGDVVNCDQTQSVMAEINPLDPHVQEVTCSDLWRFYNDRQDGYGGGALGGGAGGNPGGYEEGDCRHEQFGEWDDAKIEFCSPIVIDLDAGPFEMTRPDVWFNLTGRGARWYGWTPARSATVGWLVLDRDGDGMITSGAELFGNFTPLSDNQDGPKARHGFEALAWFDQPFAGGNGDHWIDRDDTIYARLRMWFDLNHDGISQPGELRTVPDSRVAAVSVDAYPSPRRDRYGNSILLKAEARVVLANGKEVRRPAYDVLLVVR